DLRILERGLRRLRGKLLDAEVGVPAKRRHPNSDNVNALHCLSFQMRRFCPAHSVSLMSRFRTLPTGLRGSSGQKRTDFGVLIEPRRLRQRLSSSSASALWPSFSCTTAVTASPHLGSGAPTTAQSWTAGCPQRTCSISEGKML